MNEKQRVQQVLSGNTSAFGYFVETFQDMAITIAYRICGNMQDAEDVVQESYVKAFRNLHSFRADSKFSSWLYRIVYNTAVTHMRTKIWYSEAEQIENVSYISNTNTAIDVENGEQKAMVTAILDAMPSGDALLLTLFYLEDNAIKDIAKITGLNDSNVKVKLFRARKLFKAMLLERYGKEATESINQ